MSLADRRAVDVMAVADSDDPHWAAVERELRQMKCQALRFNLTDIRTLRFTSGPGVLRIRTSEINYIASSSTSVWWRHPGSIATGDLDGEEARLAYDEGPHLLIGSLDAIGARIVDHPLTVAKAEIKLSQLATAEARSIGTPLTLVTNDPDEARQFFADRRIVAKALSPGIGIAPFVAEVTDREIDSIRTLPTMLQELVLAAADLRVVVVGKRFWIWRRSRESRTVDWRHVDPRGEEFALVSDEKLGILACQITSDLGLSMSVQDWLETDDGHVFLESNAIGAWLFLADSHRYVAPAIAEHLRFTNGR